MDHYDHCCNGQSDINPRSEVLSSLRTLSGKGSDSSQKIIHSNSSILQNLLMSDVSPSITASGPSPFDLFMLCAMFNLMQDFNLIQSSTSYFGAFNLISFHHAPFLSSLPPSQQNLTWGCKVLIVFNDMKHTQALGATLCSPPPLHHHICK